MRLLSLAEGLVETAHPRQKIAKDCRPLRVVRAEPGGQPKLLSAVAESRSKMKLLQASAACGSPSVASSSTARIAAAFAAGNPCRGGSTLYAELESRS
jgi:hypothetical protein